MRLFSRMNLAENLTLKNDDVGQAKEGVVSDAEDARLFDIDRAGAFVGVNGDAVCHDAIGAFHRTRWKCFHLAGGGVV